MKRRGAGESDVKSNRTFSKTANSTKKMDQKSDFNSVR